MTLGAKIKAARKRIRLSQQDVAALTHIDRSEISRLETDKLAVDWMRVGTVRRLCDVLDLSPYDFMEPDHGR